MNNKTGVFFIYLNLRYILQNVIIVVRNTMYAYRANALARGKQFVVHENVTTNL